MIKKLTITSLACLGFAGCVAKDWTANTNASRVPAQEAKEEAKLVYITYDNDGNLKRDDISASRWLGLQGGFSEGGREDFLAKFYSANTRGISLKNIRHASCFEGTAQDIKATFFDENDSRGKIRNIIGDHVQVKTSEDGKMLGISFEHAKKGRYHFRMTSCDFGKSGYSDSLKKISPMKGQQAKEVTMESLPKASQRAIASDQSNAYGFTMEDKAPATAGLPTFQMRADYENAFTTEKDRPWQGMDLRDEKQRVQFSLMMQKYFYEGMANQDAKNVNMNFIAAKNKSRFWCHTPWMQVGLSGREAIHGLTKELDLKPSQTNPVFANATPGSDWGVAYLNAPGCRTLQKVFGTMSQPLSEPDFNKVVFEQGTVIVKILFTTANFPAIKDAYTWKAHTSEPGLAERSIRDVRHIQMDITVKDASLQGSNATLGNTVMTGYYYDPDYSFDKDLKPIVNEENPLKKIARLPKSLMKMRPMGVQVGFGNPDTGDTVIFPGAFANGSGGRMNGPADNPRTSCLGCHGAAGTGQRMVPGFLSAKMFEPFQDKITLDFNQQLAVAKDNYATRP